MTNTLSLTSWMNARPWLTYSSAMPSSERISLSTSRICACTETSSAETVGEFMRVLTQTFLWLSQSHSTERFNSRGSCDGLVRPEHVY